MPATTIYPTSTERRIRWWGNPDDDQQPDAGDVLSYVDRTGHKPDWFHLVRHAWHVRGGGPEDLWLMVVRVDFTPEGSLPEDLAAALDTGRCFDAVRRSRGWRRT